MMSTPLITSHSCDLSSGRKLRSSLKLTNIIGSVKLVTSAVSLDVHKEVDVAHYQVMMLFANCALKSL